MNGVKPGTWVVHVLEITADTPDIQELNLREGDHVIETVRIRTADGLPVALEKNHFSMAYSYLENENLGGSLYNVLKEYGVEPKQATHDISMTYATESQAKLLNVERRADT